MTEKAISPFRRRMIEDMTIRKLAPKTQASYIRAVSDFTIFLQPLAAPGELGGSLRHYRLHLASSRPLHRWLGGLQTVLKVQNSARGRCYPRNWLC
jgi:hypothetical protein